MYKIVGRESARLICDQPSGQQRGGRAAQKGRRRIIVGARHRLFPFSSAILEDSRSSRASMWRYRSRDLRRVERRACGSGPIGARARPLFPRRKSRSRSTDPNPGLSLRSRLTRRGVTSNAGDILRGRRAQP
jgi:hypothetical protein